VCVKESRLVPGNVISAAMALQLAAALLESGLARGEFLADDLVEPSSAV
jgi:hypothetical protein